MPKPNPLNYATADMEIAEKVSWGYWVIYLLNLIGTTLSVGFFGLMLAMCNDRLGSLFSLYLGASLTFFDFVWAGLPAWYCVLSMERRPTNWRARRTLLIVSLLPFAFILLGLLILWIVPKTK